jgi:hypothetical protein
MSPTDDIETRGHQMNYALRSVFFLRQLTQRGYFKHADALDALRGQRPTYSWEDRIHWGITDRAWEACGDAKMDPLEVFAHPKVLIEHHQLIAYYRNVAVLPDKGVKYIIGYSTLPYEGDPQRPLAYRTAIEIASAFNNNTCMILEGSLAIDKGRVTGLMFASAGSSIDGSWRNKIGDDAELMVHSYLVRAAIELNVVTSLIDVSGQPCDYEPDYDYVGNVGDFTGVKLQNGCTILFSSEPDVALIDEAGCPVSAIEVKGGRDRAGALERLGAITKSFAACREENSECRTWAIIGAITPEMQRRLSHEQLVDQVWDLTRMIYDIEYKEQFIEQVRAEWLA